MKQILAKNMNYNYSSEKQSILSDFNYEFDDGEIYALIGPNGVGKTTLLRLIGKQLNCTSGSLSYSNIDGRILYLPSEVEAYPYLTINEHIEIMAEIFGMSKIQTAEFGKTVKKYIKQLGLFCFEKPMENFSLGMKYKVYLALVVAMQPDVLLLDEPFTALDNDSAIIAKNLIRATNHDRITVLTSHQVDLMQNFVTKYITLGGNNDAQN